MAAGWRTEWRTGNRIPANSKVPGSLENRYPSLGGSRVRIPPPPLPCRRRRSWGFLRPWLTPCAALFGNGGAVQKTVVCPWSDRASEHVPGRASLRPCELAGWAQRARRCTRRASSVSSLRPHMGTRRSDRGIRSSPSWN